MKTIIDFIQAWLYFPKLDQWLRYRNYNGFVGSRFQYAVKYCRMKKWHEEVKKGNECSEWTCKFQQEPICKE